MEGYIKMFNEHNDINVLALIDSINYLYFPKGRPRLESYFNKFPSG